MSIKEVANIAGVSIATVSRYFSNPEKVAKNTREKVQRAIEEANYWPNAIAQNLRSGKSSVIMLIIPERESALYSPIINKLSQLANAIDYNLLIKEEPYNSLELSMVKNFIRSKTADGFIIVAGLKSTINDVKTNDTFPIVLAYESKESQINNDLPHISINYFQAYCDATQHLLDLEHKHLAFITRNHSSYTSQEQERGFVSSCKKSQVAFTTFENEEAALSLEEKINLLFNAKTKPTAICCSDDETALEILHLVKQKGLRVPDDISVMGFHNSHYSKISDPPLTTVENSMTEVGELAMDTLINMINSQPVKAKRQLIEHKLIIRNSTCPPKK